MLMAGGMALVLAGLRQPPKRKTAADMARKEPWPRVRK